LPITETDDDDDDGDDDDDDDDGDGDGDDATDNIIEMLSDYFLDKKVFINYSINFSLLSYTAMCDCASH
jgi:hypothetical protein